MTGSYSEKPLIAYSGVNQTEGKGRVKSAEHQRQLTDEQIRHVDYTYENDFQDEAGQATQQEARRFQKGANEVHDLTAASGHGLLNADDILMGVVSRAAKNIIGRF
ncbi:hypothetical protein ACWDV4_06560 [Micromonospora sp. NPDC003197]